MSVSAIKKYSMTIKQLLSVVNVDVNDEIELTDITLDSRQVTKGSLFLAYPGFANDGRDFIDQAEQAGATAILYEAHDYKLPETIKVPAFAVNDLQAKVGSLADCFYQKPSDEMQVFGVTGTNGKTTCCYLLTQALSNLGMQAAMIGTLGAGPLNSLSDNGHTTPDAISIHRLLAQWRDQGVTQVCMEVSSHALDQGRVAGVRFFSTLFTNLSHDHLDYHGDMQQYQAAKQRLFTDYQSELVITNADDAMGSGLVDIANSGFIASYGLQAGDVRCDEIRLTQNGMTFLVETNQMEFEVETALIGEINIPNLMLVITTLLSLSIDLEEIKKIVKTLQAAPGRMELYAAKESLTVPPKKSSNRQSDFPSVVVDYAHTPDALEKALLSIRKHCKGTLWCVFGCGGDRDKTKRSVMGEVAARLVDHLVITNDNPRSESPENIAMDIESGIASNSSANVQVILDRAEAITQSITQAEKQDWVLIAGKGHETTQEIGDEIFDFSDRQHVEQCLEVAA